jgi:ubiquinone/menaquinone biosynthesis C-methylase UbiE
VSQDARPPGTAPSLVGEANPSDATGHHDWFSPTYVERWIQRDAARSSRDQLLDELVALLDVPADTPCRVLDVGAGWGPLTGGVLDRYPHATVVAQDFSEPMLNRAVRHLTGKPGQVAFVRADLRDPGWTTLVGSSFDAVVSSLAIHNVRDPATIARVYVDLHGVLRPGGVLADVDVLDGHSPDERRRWIEQAGFVDVRVDATPSGPHIAQFTARRPGPAGQ